MLLGLRRANLWIFPYFEPDDVFMKPQRIGDDRFSQVDANANLVSYV